MRLLAMEHEAQGSSRSPSDPSCCITQQPDFDHSQFTDSTIAHTADPAPPRLWKSSTVGLEVPVIPFEGPP